MLVNNVKLYRKVRVGGNKYLGSKDKRVRSTGYVLELFPEGWFCGKRVLDIGCAGGAICFAVSGEVKLAVGVDVDEGRIKAAIKIANDNNVENVQFACSNINHKKVFVKRDCIFLLNVLHHEKDPSILLGHCMGATNEYLCIEHPKKGYFSSNKAYAPSDKKVIYDWKDIEAMATSNGFELIKKKKSDAPHTKGSRIVGLFKKI